MKLKLFSLLLCSCLFAECSHSQQQSTEHPANMKGSGIAVVELFTSEGCSSCPPADALLPRLKEAYKDQVIILSFHVDYWDRLGWKDPFSSAEFSRRQNEYATAFHADNVYTPQAIVNGTAQTIGSNRSALLSLVDQAIAASAKTTLDVSARRQSGRELTVKYKATPGDHEIVYLALVQVTGTTNVRRGENSGRVLKHYNIVRDLKSVPNSSGEQRFTLPEGLSIDQCHVVAFVQRAGSMQILTAKETGID